ncbi:MAG: hypothetical protein C5B49_15320 [Bdellovibrio sp.]|nr:MAG: hypothetical protein C5B49_15320 [Bdellovibrio sp.]
MALQKKWSLEGAKGTDLACGGAEGTDLGSQNVKKRKPQGPGSKPCSIPRSRRNSNTIATNSLG